MTTQTITHLTLEALKQGLPHIQNAPADAGELALIVARPATDERTVLETAILTPENGLEGDGWRERGSRHSPDGSALLDAQITIMNTRTAQLIAQSEERWALAGDQLYVDMDLSPGNLPPGQRIQLGTAVLEITAQEHRGCLKFAQRFGKDALKFVNQDGWPLRLRGIYAKVVQAGTIQVGDRLLKQ